MIIVDSLNVGGVLQVTLCDFFSNDFEGNKQERNIKWTERSLTKPGLRCKVRNPQQGCPFLIIIMAIEKIRVHRPALMTHILYLYLNCVPIIFAVML